MLKHVPLHCDPQALCPLLDTIPESSNASSASSVSGDSALDVAAALSANDHIAEYRKKLVDKAASDLWGHLSETQESRLLLLAGVTAWPPPLLSSSSSDSEDGKSKKTTTRKDRKRGKSGSRSKDKGSKRSSKKRSKKESSSEDSSSDSD